MKFMDSSFSSVKEKKLSVDTITSLNGHILLFPPLSLLVESILKSLNIANSFSNLLLTFKIGRVNKMQMFYNYSWGSVIIHNL